MFRPTFDTFRPPNSDSSTFRASQSRYVYKANRINSSSVHS
ncbi:Protein CBG27575 [Caenorhabditis briggsae]|uniref:Protein CBG27575 n=1 Tax=Caenorhabditis briggsae TaxID=6238 RepID=B6IFR9_CAEBR|nr:Protein CBG27575 [Caenorhabditis briggsae]CAR98749.1 Protein CBG27575 [Caenorhabditis briggsae]